MSLVPWTPTKPGAQRTMPCDRGTPTRPIKSEFSGNQVDYDYYFHILSLSQGFLISSAQGMN